MNYSVIYDVNCCRDTSIRHFNPPSNLTRRVMKLTEGDDQYPYDYLGGPWLKGKHRKWAGVLTQEQFDSLVLQCDLHFEDVETMGSIGAPGFGFQHVPAFSFTIEQGYMGTALGGAYVTPMPEDDEEMKKMEQLGWDGVKAFLKEKY